jgi:hypothetical protein
MAIIVLSHRHKLLDPMKSIIFWDVTPCSLLSCNRRFGGTYRLQNACHLLTCWFLLKLFLRPWRRRWYVPPKRQLQLNRLHGVTSQKVILFITTAVKTSNLTFKVLHIKFDCLYHKMKRKIHFVTENYTSYYILCNWTKLRMGKLFLHVKPWYFKQ